MNGIPPTDAQTVNWTNISECADLIKKKETMMFEALVIELQNMGYSFDEITEAMFIDLDKRLD